MDPGYRSPLVDFFRRGEVARDVRLLAAQGAMAPRAHEQLAVLLILSDDPDPDVRGAANATIDALPRPAVSAFLARSDVPSEFREFFAARGIEPTEPPAPDDSEAIMDTLTELPTVPAEGEEDDGESRILSTLPIMDRLKLAMRGTREQRAQLVRDSNKMVAVAVMSSPKLTEAEVESFSRMGNVSEDVLRIIGTNRAWLKNYAIAHGLTRNPKTPPAISMQLIHRLSEKDVKMLANDRNVPEALRLTARRMMIKSLK